MSASHDMVGKNNVCYIYPLPSSVTKVDDVVNSYVDQTNLSAKNSSEISV